MKRDFVIIWALAFALATIFILALLSTGKETQVVYPKNFTSAMNADVVFIGSSLTGHALPASLPEQGVLGDSRSTAILYVNGLTENLSTQLLADAIDSDVETVFLEINQYAGGFWRSVNKSDFQKSLNNKPNFLNPWVRVIQEFGKRLTRRFNVLLNIISPNRIRTVRLGPSSNDGTIDAKQLEQLDNIRFTKREPHFGDELQIQLMRAREVNVEVIFFSPPRPQSVVNEMGNDVYKDLQVHMERIAAAYDVPLWYSPIPWPDDHFWDIMAHANARGRIRFQQELAQWYKARR